jgi:hypothetical protein
MKLRNIYLGLKDQLPIKRLIRNLFKGGRAMFHPRTHFNHDGSPKISYNTKATAIKSAEKMSEKTGKPFGNWKCFHCDGYHIGKNRPKV